MGIHSAKILLDTGPLGHGLRYNKHSQEARSPLFPFHLVGGRSSLCSSWQPQSRGVQRFPYCERSPINICYPLLPALVDLLNYVTVMRLMTILPHTATLTLCPTTGPDMMGKADGGWNFRKQNSHSFPLNPPSGTYCSNRVNNTISFKDIHSVCFLIPSLRLESPFLTDVKASNTWY